VFFCERLQKISTVFLVKDLGNLTPISIKKPFVVSSLCWFLHTYFMGKIPVSTLGGLFPHGVLPTPNLLEKKIHCRRATATMGSVTSDSSSVVAEGAPALAAAGEGSAAAAGAAGAAGGSASVQPGG